MFDDPLASAVQGNITPGFNKDFQAFLLITFSPPEAAHGWLNEVVPEIASSGEVAAFNSAYRSVKARLGGDEDRTAQTISATWTNLALSGSGLRAVLGQRRMPSLSAAFVRNQVPLVQTLARADALLIVAADRPADLEAALERHRQMLRRHGGRETGHLRGATLPGPLRGHEHFGFKDAVSQPSLPGVVGLSGGAAGRQDDALTPLGEIILGEPDATGNRDLSGAPWTTHGSYLVFLQLQQHVQAFRESMSREARRFGVAPEVLAATIVGRHQDGQLVGDPVPRLSHVGRSHPYWLPAREVARHRLIRRGIPYGQPLADGAPDDGQRGLLFVSYQADIARQFEQVWAHWLNEPNFPGPGAGTDPLVGQTADGGASLALPARSPRLTPADAVSSTNPYGPVVGLRLTPFVTPLLGGYFFSPSLPSLRQLAT